MSTMGKSVNEWSEFVREWRIRKGFFTPSSMDSECKHDTIPTVAGRWCCKCGSYSTENTMRKTINPSTNSDALLGKLMLVVSEVAEAAEAVRHQDRDNFREEIADTFIRLFDICGSMNIDIESEIEKKMKINEDRPIRHGKKTKL